MNRSSFDSEALDGLLSAWADGPLSSAQAEQLCFRLEDSSEAREAYVSYAMLHAMLEQAHLPALDGATSEETRPDSCELDQTTYETCAGKQVSPPACAPPLGDDDDGAAGWFPAWTHISSRSLFFISLLVLCAVTSFWIGAQFHDHISHNGGGRHVADNPARDSSSSTATPSSRLSDRAVAATSLTPPAAVAHLTRAANARWTNPQAVLRESAALVIGQKIDLASGEVEIAFGDGAVIVLRGASMLEIESANSVRLLLGHVTARAESVKAHGFTIHTRTASMCDLGTQFEVQAAADGHSQVAVTAGAVELRAGNLKTVHRLEAGDMAEIEPGERGVRAIIEPGDGTPAFRFPTIEPPSAKDYADTSQHRASLRVLRGKLAARSGPLELLIDGRGQSSHDSPGESVYFPNDVASGLILMDLHRNVAVEKINTYSWHQEWQNAPNRTRAPQKYFLYGLCSDDPPSVEGNLAANGWTLIARVNTDEFFFDEANAPERPAQQVVSITAGAGPIGSYRYLLWDVRPTLLPHPADVKRVNTFYGEFDVFGE